MSAEQDLSLMRHLGVKKSDAIGVLKCPKCHATDIFLYPTKPIWSKKVYKKESNNLLRLFTPTFTLVSTDADSHNYCTLFSNTNQSYYYYNYCGFQVLLTPEPKRVYWQLFSGLSAVRAACILNNISYKTLYDWFHNHPAPEQLLEGVIKIESLTIPVMNGWTAIWINRKVLCSANIANNTKPIQEAIKSDPEWISAACNGFDNIAGIIPRELGVENARIVLLNKKTAPSINSIRKWYIGAIESVVCLEINNQKIKVSGRESLPTAGSLSILYDPFSRHGVPEDFWMVNCSAAIDDGWEVTGLRVNGVLEY